MTPTEAPILDALPDEGRRLHNTDEDLPPYRINATRVPERLSSSLPSLHHRRRSGDRGSRSRSPSMKDDSSISSLDDSDILTDRMGFEDFDLQKQKLQAEVNSCSSLQPVWERLTDDSLEDNQAFSDVTRTTGSVSSRANSIATGGDVGSLLLETLDECDDEEEGGVHISNLDEIHEEDVGSPTLDDLPSEGKAYFYTDEDLPPLRLHAVRVPDRLAMSHSSFFPPVAHASPAPFTHFRRKSLTDLYTHKKKDADGNSSISSMGDLDILTDRMGFQELDMAKQKVDGGPGSSCSSLQPVNERLSEDTMEDCHAFNDVVRSGSVASGGHSRANSITTGGDAASILETLDEIDESDEEDEAGVFHISNLENLKIDEESEEGTKPSDTSQAATFGTF